MKDTNTTTATEMSGALMTAKLMYLHDFIAAEFGGDNNEASSFFDVTVGEVNEWLDIKNDGLYQVEIVKDEFGHLLVNDVILMKTIARKARKDSRCSQAGYVYAVSNSEITKIGYSYNPEIRVKTVARELGFDDYEYYISKKTDRNSELETACHKKLASRITGHYIYPNEVFNCTLKDAKKVIDNLNQGIKTGPRTNWKAVRNDGIKWINDKFGYGLATD